MFPPGIIIPGIGCMPMPIPIPIIMGFIFIMPFWGGYIPIGLKFFPGGLPLKTSRLGRYEWHWILEATLAADWNLRAYCHEGQIAYRPYQDNSFATLNLPPFCRFFSSSLRRWIFWPSFWAEEKDCSSWSASSSNLKILSGISLTSFLFFLGLGFCDDGTGCLFPKARLEGMLGRVNYFWTHFAKISSVLFWFANWIHWIRLIFDKRKDTLNKDTVKNSLVVDCRYAKVSDNSPVLDRKTLCKGLNRLDCLRNTVIDLW